MKKNEKEKKTITVGTDNCFEAIRIKKTGEDMANGKAQMKECSRSTNKANRTKNAMMARSTCEVEKD